MQLSKEEIIENLKLEKTILADGGYGRSVRTPWRSNQYLRDSITCPNVGESEKTHPCSECFLIDYVHPSHRDLKIPCHFIPLNAAGDTIGSLIQAGNSDKLEQDLLAWIDNTISRLESWKSKEEIG